MRFLTRPVGSLLLAGMFLVTSSNLFGAKRVTVSTQGVINLLDSKISERDILIIIDVNDANFSLTPGEITRLKRAGASERILNAMIQKQGGASPPGAPNRVPQRTSPPQRADRVETRAAALSAGEQDRQLIAEFEAKHSKPAANSAPRTVTVEQTAAEEERRLIEQFEAGRSTPPKENADEESRLIAEFEAEQSSPPSLNAEEEERRLIAQFDEENSSEQAKQQVPASGLTVKAELVLDGSKGTVRINGESVAFAAEGLNNVLAQGRNGENRFEAHLVSGTGIPGTLQLDLGDTASFRPGSIRVVDGMVAKMTEDTILFQLLGLPEEHVEFVFQLEK